MEDKTYQKINSVSKYIEAIFKLRNTKSDTVKDADYWFFRGQKSSEWSVRPSAFRDDKLSIESNIIQHALRQRPYDFRECQSDFEILTKLQHYGLGTRLLDVTLNPLVALYFASEDFAELEYGKDKRAKAEKKDGKIFCRYTYGCNVTELNVRIASAIPFLDLENDMSISAFAQTLKDIRTINENEYSYLCKDNYRALIKAIQTNNYVVSSYSNDRLIRQSGSFVVPAVIKIIKNELDFSNSSIRKTICDLECEFDECCFIIPHGKKEEIREELDFLNINKATLFPELEHQLVYLQGRKFNSKTHIEEFEKYEDIVVSITKETKIKKDYVAPTPDVEQILNNYFIEDNVMKLELKTIISATMKDVDWWLKETNLSMLRLNIRNKVQETMSANDSRHIATKIVEEILK